MRWFNEKGRIKNEWTNKIWNYKRTSWLQFDYNGNKIICCEKEIYNLIDLGAIKIKNTDL